MNDLKIETAKVRPPAKRRTSLANYRVGVEATNQIEQMRTLQQINDLRIKAAKARPLAKRRSSLANYSVGVDRRDHRISGHWALEPAVEAGPAKEAEADPDPEPSSPKISSTPRTAS